jgi:hypothetical protein
MDASIEKFLELFSGIAEHCVVAFEIKIGQKVGPFLHLHFPRVDTLASLLT